MDKINQLKKGNNTVFKEVFDQYHSVLYKYIFSKTKSDYFSQEIVQEVFFKLWKYKESLNESIPLNAQIFRIAKTLLINELKKKANQKSYDLMSDYDVSSYESVYETIFHKELQENLYTLVDKFPPIRKKVFEMSRFECLSYKEISKELNISTKTVENHISLAIKQLKPLLTSMFLWFLCN